MYSKTSLDYMENCERSLKQNLFTIKQNYNYEFNKMWKDFEYGLNGFKEEKISDGTRETYRKRLMKIWNLGMIQEGILLNGK